MKKIIFRLLLVMVAIFSTCQLAPAQSINKIASKCPTTSLFASIRISNAGAITYAPCAGQSSVFTGAVDFSGATVTGIVSGSGTDQYVPQWSGTSALVDTPLSWNGSSYAFSDTARTATFNALLTPASAGGTMSFGTVASTRLLLTQASSTIEAQALIANIGDPNARANNTVFTLNDSTRTFDFSSGAPTAIFNLTDILTFNVLRTSAGSTGAQVINQPFGSVQFAAAATTLVVTNSTASATSYVFVTPQSLDATCRTFLVTRGVGSFTLTANAACTGTTTVAFWVVN